MLRTVRTLGPEDRRLVYQPVPSTVDFPALERDILAFWEQSRAFEKLVEKNANGPRWSFIDGPITANNPMGVHHAWGRTYKDVFQRFYAMQGYQVKSIRTFFRDHPEEIEKIKALRIPSVINWNGSAREEKMCQRPW